MADDTRTGGGGFVAGDGTNVDPVERASNVRYTLDAITTIVDEAPAEAWRDLDLAEISLTLTEKILAKIRASLPERT